MITLNKLAYNIKNLAHGSSHSTEEDLDIRQIKHWVHYHRSKIIADNINKGILNHHALYQEYRLNAFTYYYEHLINYINDWITWNEDVSSSTVQPDISDTSAYGGDIGTKFMRNFPVLGGNEELQGKFIVDCGMTNPGGGAEYQNARAKINRNQYGKAKKDRQLIGDWRNNGDAIFSIPEILMIDNYRSVKDILLSRVTHRTDMPTDGMGNDHSPISVPIKTGVGKRFINQAVAEIYSNSKVTGNEHEKDTYLLKISNLQASPNYFDNNSIITPSKYTVLWAYDGTLSAIFTDPTQVVYKRYRSNWSKPHWDDDINPYPIPMEYVQDLIQRVISVEVKTSMSTPSDFINDATDTTKLMSMQKQQSGS